MASAIPWRGVAFPPSPLLLETLVILDIPWSSTVGQGPVPGTDDSKASLFLGPARARVGMFVPLGTDHATCAMHGQPCHGQAPAHRDLGDSVHCSRT